MSFNALGQYTASHKTWDHVGNMLPNVEHSEGVRPAIEFKPAAWLPVQFFDKYYENWNVVLPGKIVALDNDGRVVPAQYGLTSASITYAQNDIDAGVLDVRTGVTLVSGGLGTFNVSAVTDFMGRGESEALAISKPIGVAPYAYLRWAGGDGSNPAELLQHNYQMQHMVAVLCDYVIELPLIPDTQASTSLTFGSPSSNVSTSSAVGNLPVAANTVRTPISWVGSTTLFLNEVATAALVTAAGDWHINLATGVVSVYATAQPTGISIAYYHYASVPTTVSKFACALGDLKPGDFVKCGANSNYVVATASTGSGSNSGDPFQDIIGQVLDRDSGYPKDMLDRVRTAYNPALNTLGTGGLPGSLGQLDQMPGSANGGYPDTIHYAGASNTIVRVNLVSR